MRLYIKNILAISKIQKSKQHHILNLFIVFLCCSPRFSLSKLLFCEAFHKKLKELWQKLFILQINNLKVLKISDDLNVLIW